MNNTLKMLPFLSCLCLCLCLFPTFIQGFQANHERKPYIVYMGELPNAQTQVEHHHHDLLSIAVGDVELARKSKIHSYGKSFNGFVARLLPHEAKRLAEEETVVSIFPNKYNKLHTTRTWDFVGMPLNVKRKPQIESSIVVGLLDTGIYMGCPSFKDERLGPPPATWKGKCVKGANFTGCNNKVIGAKYFNLDATNPYFDDPSPVDDDGHGTHTASTAAGSTVIGASLYGIARGTARGAVPSARIAMYKVCWSNGCSDMDLLAAFDEAIADGVDVLSVSIGGPARNLFEDPIAIGSFHAMKKGILTSCSAGNDGPFASSVQNGAPWILTVAATGIDRQFLTRVTLGNGDQISGIAINTFTPKKKMYPLTSGALATNLTDDMFGNASACDSGTLGIDKVKGKVVFCLGNTGNADDTIKRLSGAGVIMTRSDDSDILFIPIIAETTISTGVGVQVDNYINSTKNPKAVIHKTVTTKIPAPFVPSFSGRGPQRYNFNVLKPDLAAPGLNILAGYSKLTTISGLTDDDRFNVYNILTGTSMACPHASGAAAYVKSFHPAWSPSAIKSALMTTATPMKITDMLGELSSGSGQINPVQAVHPGLIYDLSLDSYISFLCKAGYNNSAISSLLGHKNYTCSAYKSLHGTDGLNYPTMHAQINADSDISAVFFRTVTNVGQSNSVYKAKVTTPRGLSVQVIPDTLIFTRVLEKQSFKVVLNGSAMHSGQNTVTAVLEWSDSRHNVRSPILLYRPVDIL